MNNKIQDCVSAHSGCAPGVLWWMGMVALLWRVSNSKWYMPPRPAIAAAYYAQMTKSQLSGQVLKLVNISYELSLASEYPIQVTILRSASATGKHYTQIAIRDHHWYVSYLGHHPRSASTTGEYQMSILPFEGSGRIVYIKYRIYFPPTWSVGVTGRQVWS